MRLLYKITGVIVILLAVALLSLSLVLNYVSMANSQFTLLLVVQTGRDNAFSRSVAVQNNVRSSNSRRILPISLSTNG